VFKSAPRGRVCQLDSHPLRKASQSHTGLDVDSCHWHNHGWRVTRGSRVVHVSCIAEMQDCHTCSRQGHSTSDETKTFCILGISTPDMLTGESWSRFNGQPPCMLEMFGT
jgi:hypothetical protein